MPCYPGLILLALLALILIAIGSTAGLWVALGALAIVAALGIYLFRRNGWR